MDLAIDYLASDKPFQNRLGPRAEEENKGDEEGKENKQDKQEENGDGDGDATGQEGEGRVKTAEPLLEALCDTIWGVDAMVRPSHRCWL